MIKANLRKTIKITHTDFYQIENLGYLIKLYFPNFSDTWPKNSSCGWITWVKHDNSFRLGSHLYHGKEYLDTLTLLELYMRLSAAKIEIPAAALNAFFEEINETKGKTE